MMLNYIKTLCIATIVFFHTDLLGQVGTFELVSTGINEPLGFKQLDENNYISVSNKTNSNPAEISVLKFNSNKLISWSKNIKVSSSFNSIAYEFIIDRDKNIVIIGSLQTKMCFILKLNGSDGNVIFMKTISFNGGSGSSRYYRMIQMNEGISDDYVLVGTVNYPSTHCVTRIDKTGNTIWAKEYDVSGGNELAYAIAQSYDGDIIIGCNMSNGGQFDQGIIKINAANGNIKMHHKYDFSYGTATNGGFDACVAIAGTKLIAFSLHLNGNSNPTRQGVVLYNTETESVVKVQMYNIGYQARTFTMAYDKTRNKILMGGGFMETNNNNLFVQSINANDLTNVITYKLKSIDYNTHITGNATVSLDFTDKLLLSGFISSKTPPLTSSRIVLGIHTFSKSDCIDIIPTTLFNASTPSPTVSSISLIKNYSHNDNNPIITNQSFVVKPLCEEKCIPTSKLFNINYSKTIDTICHNQTSYSPIITVSNNPDDAIVNIVLHKKNGNVYLPVDSLKDNKQVRFNIINIGDLENYMLIGKKNCSFNDTIFIQLKRHYLIAKDIIHPNYYCKNESIQLSSDLVKSYFYPVEYRWWNQTTGETLGTNPSLDLTLTKSIAIALRIDDRCAPVVDLLTTLYVAPDIIDSTIVINKLGCEPYPTEFIHPKTDGPNDIKTTFKWQWSINAIHIDSTISEAGKTENNIPYIFKNANNYSLSVAMIMPNNKICHQLSDQIVVLKKSIANFDISPSAIDILDSSVKFTNKSSNAVSYLWNISDGTTYSSVSPSHPITQISEYWVQLIAYSNNDCHDTIIKKYIVHDIYRYFQPDGFSPNGDGVNDIWSPKFTSAKEIELMIFNRWGEMIVKSNDISCSWDGTYKDEPCQEGIYIYMIKVRTQKLKMHYYKGTIILLR